MSLSASGLGATIHNIKQTVATGLLVCGAASAAAAALPTASPDPLHESYPSTYTPLPAETVFIADATILDGAGRRVNNGDLLLVDGKIEAIGANLTAPEGAVVVDARGRWVTPGIIDVHSHLGNATFPLVPAEIENWDVNEATNPNTAEVRAAHGLSVKDPGFSRALAGGVTTLHVLPGSSNVFGGRGVVLKNVPANTVQRKKFADVRPTLKMACGENPKYTYGSKGRAPSSRMGVIAFMRMALIDAQEYQRAWDEYRRSNGKSNGESDDADAQPPDRDLALETLAGVLRGDVAVHVHCYRAEDMAIVIDVANEFDFQITAFHHAVEAYKIAGLLARENICAAVWPDWWGYKMEAYDAIRANAPFVAAAGGCVAMHSDSSVVGQRLTLEVAKAAAAGRRAGLDIPPEEAIRWVTANSASMLGLEERIGSLEAGKNADVVVWSGDPFSVYTKADLVFIDGARVYDRSNPGRQPVPDFELGQPVLLEPSR